MAGLVAMAGQCAGDSLNDMADLGRDGGAGQGGVDEVYLWPDALPRNQVAIASESVINAVYPHRSEVPRDGWERLFTSAESRRVPDQPT